MQQGEGENKREKQGKEESCKGDSEGKNEEQATVLLRIEQKLCLEWNTSLRY